MDTAVFDYVSPPIMPGCGKEHDHNKVKYIPEGIPNYNPPYTYKDQHYVTRTGCAAPMTIEREVPGIVEGFGDNVTLLIKILILFLILWLVYLLYKQFTIKPFDIKIDTLSLNYPSTLSK